MKQAIERRQSLQERDLQFHPKKKSLLLLSLSFQENHLENCILLKYHFHVLEFKTKLNKERSGSAVRT